MTVIDSTIFFILTGMGFASLVISSKFGAVFAILGAVGFFAVSLMLFSNYDVVSTTTYSDGSNQWNETNYIIGSEGDTIQESQQKNWIAWIFFVLGLIAIVLFFVESLKMGKAN